MNKDDTTQDPGSPAPMPSQMTTFDPSFAAAMQAQMVNPMDGMPPLIDPLLPPSTAEKASSTKTAKKATAKTAKKKASSKTAKKASSIAKKKYMDTSQWDIELWKEELAKENTLRASKGQPKLSIAKFAEEHKHVNAGTLQQLFAGTKKPGGKRGTGLGSKLIADHDLNPFVQDIMANRSKYMTKGGRGTSGPKLSKQLIMDKYEIVFADSLPAKYNRDKAWDRNVRKKCWAVMESEEVEGEVAPLGAFNETDALEMLD